MIIDRFKKLYSELNNDSLKQLPKVYSQNVTFIDPVGTHNGLTALTDYFHNLLEAEQPCRFTINDIAYVDNSGTVAWVMHYQHPKLNAGHPLQLEGVSLVKVKDDLIYYQRDYYDLGQMLYEHVPVVGFLVKKLKSRLKG